MDKYKTIKETRMKDFSVEFQPKNEWHIQANEHAFIKNYLQEIGFQYKWEFILNLDNKYLFDNENKKYYFHFKIQYLFEGREIIHSEKKLKKPKPNAGTLLQNQRKSSKNLLKYFKRR